MGDDDFDIYGEDDGYTEAVTFEVRMITSVLQAANLIILLSSKMNIMKRPLIASVSAKKMQKHCQRAASLQSGRKDPAKKTQKRLSKAIKNLEAMMVLNIPPTTRRYLNKRLKQ